MEGFLTFLSKADQWCDRHKFLVTVGALLIGVLIGRFVFL